ncbi:MAG: hypothetical protein HY520_01320 [Candidatus Aenigmarchaeota archaeon]|nr:hypothetical protein [Candidatus Aenigmarchaeota archaeon]
MDLLAEDRTETLPVRADDVKGASYPTRYRQGLDLPGDVLDQGVLHRSYARTRASYTEVLYSADPEPEKITFPDPDVTFRTYTRSYPRTGLVYGGWDVHRVPAHEMGYGILGRCWPTTGRIEIRSDLYGDDFIEVLTHEATHMTNPDAPEQDVREMTRRKLSFSARWH